MLSLALSFQKPCHSNRSWNAAFGPRQCRRIRRTSTCLVHNVIESYLSTMSATTPSDPTSVMPSPMPFVRLLVRLFPGANRALLVRLLRENFRKHWGLYAVAIVAMVFVAATTAASAWIMRDVTDDLLIDRDLTKLSAIAGGIAVIFTVKGIATYVQSYWLARAGNSIIAATQLRIFDRLMRQGVSFYSSNATSDLIVRVTHNAQAARGVIETIVTGFVRDLLSLLGLVGVMFYQQPMIALVALVIGPIAIGVIRVLLRQVREIMKLELASLNKIVQVMQESTAGIRVIKAFSLEPVMRTEMEGAVRGVEQRANAITRLEAATSPLMETLAGFGIAGVLALSAVLVSSGGTTAGELVSFITALLLAYEPAKRLARMRVSIEAGMVGVGFMFELLDRPITLLERQDATPLPTGTGEVCFQGASFSYDGVSPVLHGVDLTFPAGRTTALVGPSGGGKSTMVNLIMRLYDPTEGRVLIDGHDIASVTLASLRARMSYVGQDTFLFAGSVRHNIAMGRANATDAEIEAAARAANAHDFIERLPTGYDSPVGENGGNLSGGQRQRIAIARAILHDAPILILDEATSALDAHSEVAVRDALANAAEGRTTIVIAHRLSTIALADKIVVMENGHVAEEGAPAELLGRDGPYRRLYDTQFGEAKRAA